MNLLLLGATGRTGRLALVEALHRGHRLHALVRNPRVLAMPPSPALHVFQGVPADLSVLAEAMRGCDAVVSALNLSRTSDWPWSPLRSPVDFLSQSMQAILATATRTGVTRIVITSASGVGDSRCEIPGWFDWFIRHSNLRFPYADHERQEALLAASRFQWTAVRPTGLTNSTTPQSVRVSFNGSPPPRLTISRLAVARFLLDAVESGAHVRQTPTISGE